MCTHVFRISIGGEVFVKLFSQTIGLFVISSAPCDCVRERRCSLLRRNMWEGETALFTGGSRMGGRRGCIGRGLAKWFACISALLRVLDM